MITILIIIAVFVLALVGGALFYRRHQAHIEADVAKAKSL